jgi:hypothetical protein
MIRKGLIKRRSGQKDIQAHCFFDDYYGKISSVCAFHAKAMGGAGGSVYMLVR